VEQRRSSEKKLLRGGRSTSLVWIAGANLDLRKGKGKGRERKGKKKPPIGNDHSLISRIPHVHFGSDAFPGGGERSGRGWNANGVGQWRNCPEKGKRITQRGTGKKGCGSGERLKTFSTAGEKLS